MTDKYKIDSHKLIYHPQRVAQWLDANNDWEKLKKIYPIYVEISPYGGCNHRCSFCAVDYIGYKNIKWDPDKLKQKLTEMAELGIKSVMFAGEGEPLLWKPIYDILAHCAKIGIDTSLTTNLVPAQTDKMGELLQHLSWMKISINAGTAKTYAKIHATKEADFAKVLQNIQAAVQCKQQYNYKCAIGAQMLLLPENQAEVLVYTKLMRELGVNYVVIKPYSQHQYSNTKKYAGLTYESMMDLEDKLQQLNNANFHVVFRSQTMDKLLYEAQKYKKCYSTPFFWAYIMTDGSLYGCSAYLKRPEFCYGNLNDAGFKELWEGEKRKQSLAYIQNSLNIKNCRVNCRMTAINEYLWQLKHPNEHVNFI